MEDIYIPLADILLTTKTWMLIPCKAFPPFFTFDKTTVSDCTLTSLAITGVAFRLTGCLNNLELFDVYKEPTNTIVYNRYYNSAL